MRAEFLMKSRHRYYTYLDHNCCHGHGKRSGRRVEECHAVEGILGDSVREGRLTGERNVRHFGAGLELRIPPYTKSMTSFTRRSAAAIIS